MSNTCVTHVSENAKDSDESGDDELVNGEVEEGVKDVEGSGGGGHHSKSTNAEPEHQNVDRGLGHVALPAKKSKRGKNFIARRAQKHSMLGGHMGKNSLICLTGSLTPRLNNITCFRSS